MSSNYHIIIAFVVVYILCFGGCHLSESKTADNSTVSDDVEFAWKSAAPTGDTLYPVPVTDSVQRHKIIGMLENKSVLQKDFSTCNLEEAEYFRLGDYLLVKCILVGPSGWSSNLYHYFIIDLANRKDFYFGSFSKNQNNIFLSNDLVVNSLVYSDRFFSDEDFFENFFKNDPTTFKLIRQRLSTSTLQVDSEFEKDTILMWSDAYESMIQ